jgi:hypothetical protein
MLAICSLQIPVMLMLKMLQKEDEKIFGEFLLAFALEKQKLNLKTMTLV